MITLSEDQARVKELQYKFHQTRADYELGLRKFILNEANNCPCCFKGLLNTTKDSVKQQAFYSNFEPDELEILENMYSIITKEDEKVDE